MKTPLAVLLALQVAPAASARASIATAVVPQPAPLEAWVQASSEVATEPKERSLRKGMSATEIGGLVGVGVGFRFTPSKTTEMYPGTAVRTAEAWRRRTLSRQPIPLSCRAPSIIAISLACSVVTGYAAAVPEHGAVGAAQHLHASRLCVRVAQRFAAVGQRCADWPLVRRVLGQWPRRQAARRELGGGKLAIG